MKNLGRIKISLFFALLLGICSSNLWASKEVEGVKAYQEGRYYDALLAFTESQQLDANSPWTHFNMGTTLYRIGQFDKALEELKLATMGGDSLISRNAFYNMAGAEFRKGEASQKSEDKIAQYRKAIANLKKAVDYDENYELAKKNIEVIQRLLKEEIQKLMEEKQKQQQQEQEKDKKDDKKKEKKEPSPASQQAFKRVMQLVREHKYQQAFDLLSEVIAGDEGAEKYQSTLQRIKDIVDIDAGIKPAAPAESNNLEDDLGVI